MKIEITKKVKLMTSTNKIIENGLLYASVVLTQGDKSITIEDVIVDL